MGGTIYDGRTPLHLSANGGSVEVVRMLMQQEANTEVTSCDGQTPLHSGANEGHVEVDKMLIGKGANIEAIG